MRRRSSKEAPEALREKIIGLGERSFRKSYYPQLQEQLANLQRFRALLDQSSDAIFLLQVPSGRMADVNESACRQLLFPREKLLSLSLGDIAGPEADGPVAELFRQGRAAGTQPDRAVAETVLLKGNGETIPVEITIRLVSFGGSLYAVAAARDMTERRRAEELIKETARRQKAILDSIPDMAWLKDREERYIAVNEAYGRISGWQPAAVPGHTDLEIWPPAMARKSMADDQEVMWSGQRLTIEESLTDHLGNFGWYETIKTPISNEKGEVVGTTGIARDITRRKQMEETISYQAHHDLLTGLPNRMLFLDHLGLELSQARRSGSILAVLFLDLDRFKNINDALGHSVGDLLLQQVAGRLAATLRDTDTIARLGGDDFTILLPRAGNIREVTRIAEKIQSSLKEPFLVNGQQLHIT
nr:diguanylate cyclase [Desulfobacteraceae bacterium]